MSIDNIIKQTRQFNVSTLEIMDKYRSPSQKAKRDEELRELCIKNLVLVSYPHIAGKAVYFIEGYINS